MCKDVVLFVCIYIEIQPHTYTRRHVFVNNLLYAASTHSHVTSIGRNARKQSRQCMPPMTTYLACRHLHAITITNAQAHTHACILKRTHLHTHVCVCVWPRLMYLYSYVLTSYVLTCVHVYLHARTHSVNPMALHGKFEQTEFVLHALWIRAIGRANTSMVLFAAFVAVNNCAEK